MDGSLTIASGAALQDPSHVSTIGDLVLPQDGSNNFIGTLDLGTNALIIESSPSNRQQVLSMVIAAIASGYNNGGWNGKGITTSAAITNSNYGLGFIVNDSNYNYSTGQDNPGGPASIYTSFAGQTVDSNSIIIAYTLLGDANLDGKVNGTDFVIMAANFNHMVSGWAQGDFNYDGKVNGTDFVDLTTNFNQAVTLSQDPELSVSPQYLATFMDSRAGSSPGDFTAGITWGDGPTVSVGIIVDDGNGTFHVLANHTYQQGGSYGIVTQITDTVSSANTSVTSMAAVMTTPTGLTIVQAIEGEIDIQWNADPDPDLAGFNVYVSTDPIFLPSSGNEIASDVTENGYTDNFLSDPSTTWYYKVIAVDTSGDQSAPSSASTGAMMPASTSDSYTDAPDLYVPTDWNPSSEPSSSQPAVPGNDLVAFYGAGSTNSAGNLWFKNIADNLNNAGFTEQNNKIYRDWQDETALTDLLSMLDANGDHVITPAEIGAVKVDVIGYSWGALAATNFTRYLSQANPNAGGLREMQGKSVVYVGGWNLEAPVPIQILDTIDPVLHAVGGLSGLIRNTQGPLANVVNFNNYYEQRGGSTQVEELYAGSPIGQSPDIGNSFSEGIEGDPLNSQAQNTLQIRVDTAWAGLQEEAPYAPGDPDYSGVDALLSGSEAQHDTMPLYLYEVVGADFGVQLPL